MVSPSQKRHAAQRVVAAGVCSRRHVWRIDLIFDVTHRGPTVKFLTILDEGSHYCIDIVSGRRLGAREAVEALAAANALHGTPRICAATTAASSLREGCRFG